MDSSDKTDPAPARTPPPFSFGRFDLLLAIVVLFLSIGIYHSVLTQGLMRDDFCWLSLAREGLSDSSIVFSRFVSGFFRPVVHLSFFSTYAAFGDQAWPYYATNLFLDAACTLLVAWLAMQLTRSRVAAAVAVAMFVTHPHHAEVVAWVSARTSSLMAMFSLLALIGWTKFRERSTSRWATVTLFAFAAALGSKEEAAILLPLIVLLDWIVLRDPSRRPMRAGPRAGRPPVVLFTVCCAILAAYLAAQYAFQSSNPIVTGGGFSLRGEGFVRALWRIPRLFLHKHVASPRWAVTGFLVLAAVATGMLRTSAVELRRTGMFGLALALLAVLPTSFFESADHPMRYDYFATCGSAIAWGAVAAASIDRLRQASPTMATRLIAVLLLCTLGLATPAQAYRLRQSLRPFESDARLGGKVHAAMVAIAPDLENARQKRASVIVAAPPLPLLDMQCLCHLVSGIPRESVKPVYNGDTKQSATTNETRIGWRDASGQFVTTAPGKPAG